MAAELEALREEGLVASVGISGYEEADVASALEAFDTLDVVQVPVNVLDQRLDGSRILAEVRDRGGRIQARSILLQGAAVRRPSTVSSAPTLMSCGSGLRRPPVSVPWICPRADVGG